MNLLFWIILSTFLISLIAFIGALTLFLREEILDKILLVLVALSAGALIGGAFLHLLPEAISKIDVMKITPFNLFLFLLFGFCLFFILEQFFLWHHSHDSKKGKKPVSYLILISDSVHNFIDGLAIAASFVISLPLGFITVLAIALHEIPQEIGDFGVLVYGGFKKSKALLFNFITAVTVILGGIVGYVLSGVIGSAIIYLLPFAAGNFIYIAASDLIPEIKHEKNVKRSLLYFFTFLAGLILMFLIKLL